MKATARRSPFAGSMRHQGGGPRKGLASWALRFLVLFGALLALVLASPLVIWWSTTLGRPWQAASSGTLVVLSGPAADSQGMLGDSSYWRSVYAVRAWKEGHFERILIVGQPCAHEMALFLRASGIPAARVFVNDQPADTHEAALAVAAVAPKLPLPISVLTSDFHVLRTSAAFRKVGLAPSMLPFPDGAKRGQLSSWSKRLSVFGDLVEESTELARYRWNGWI